MDLSFIVVTDRWQARQPLADVVAAVLDGGARTVLLREKDLPQERRWELAEQLRARGADVIVAGPDPLGGRAIHLAATDPLPTAARKGAAACEGAGGAARDAGFGGAWVIGRSCHGVGDELTIEHYCTLSPIFASPSKPGYGPALGVEVLGARDNIVALGGIGTREQVVLCREAGAMGVAVMGAVMRADDPATVVKGLLP